MTVNIVKGLLAKAQQNTQTEAVQKQGNLQVAQTSQVSTFQKNTDAAYNNIRSSKVDRPAENKIRSYKEASELADDVVDQLVSDTSDQAIGAHAGLSGDSSVFLR